MSKDVREFLDYWLKYSGDLARSFGAAESHQNSVRNLVGMAEALGLTRQQLEDEVGDLTAYLVGRGAQRDKR